MTKIFLRLFVICHLLFVISDRVFAGQPLGLFDCYRLALERSEKIRIHKELIQQSQANFQSAFSGILPRVSYVAKELKEEGLGWAPERKLLVTQPLFRGFKEFAAMSRGRFLNEQRSYEKKRAEQLLFLDVSDSFYQILELERDLKILLGIEKLSRDWIRELASWIRIGRARESEMAAAKSQLKRVQAEIAKTRRLLAVSREVMVFLTGLERFRLSEEEWGRGEKGTRYRTFFTVQERPDVVAKEKQAMAAQANIKVERADLFPSVDLEGNSFQERSGSKKNVDWDFLFTIDIPIFEGGGEWADLKESQSLFREAELQSKLSKRQAESDVRSAYEQFKHSLAEQNALRAALNTAKKSHKLQLEDYRLSLIHYLDLLSSLRELQEVRRDLNHVEYQVKRSFWNLKVASGQLEPKP